MLEPATIRQDPLETSNDSRKICSRRIYDERMAGIEFDDERICSYCHQIESLKQQYGTGLPQGTEKLKRYIENIKDDGRGK